MNQRVSFVLTAGAMMASLASAAETSLPSRVDFNRDVRPILSDN